MNLQHPRVTIRAILESAGFQTNGVKILNCSCAIHPDYEGPNGFRFGDFYWFCCCNGNGKITDSGNNVDLVERIYDIHHTKAIQFLEKFTPQEFFLVKENLIPDTPFFNTYLEYHSQITDCTLHFALFCALGILSSVACRKIWIPYGDRKLFPNLYICLLAPSSRFRKSESIGIARRIIMLVNPELVFPN